MTDPPKEEPSAKPTRRWSRLGFLLVLYAGLLALGHWGSEWIIEAVGVDLSSQVKSHARHVVMAGIGLYTVLMAIPFVPGMEISLALFAAFGHQVAILIYGATVAALTASFLIGRLVPIKLLAAMFSYFGMSRAKALVDRLEPLKANQRLDVLMEQAPKRIVPLLLKHRYLAIAVAFNIPGNAIIGGGGGIALLAGISGLFSFPLYLAVMSLAVLPVPLVVLLFGN